MDDFPMASRMPGSEGALSAEEFDPGEIAGMRSAGVILLATAALGLLVWMVRPTVAPVAVIVDGFLGVQLLRLRHSWRAWALVRAWIGLGLGTVIALVGAFGSGLGAAVLGLSQVAYAGSLLLLIFGVPTMKRVRAGHLLFALSILLTIAGVALSLALRSPDATTSRWNRDTSVVEPPNPAEPTRTLRTLWNRTLWNPAELSGT